MLALELEQAVIPRCTPPAASGGDHTNQPVRIETAAHSGTPEIAMHHDLCEGEASSGPPEWTGEIYTRVFARHQDVLP